MLITILLFSCVLLALYAYFLTNKHYKYWDERNVFYVKPTYFFGNLKDVVFRKKSIFDIITDIYYSDVNARFIGMYQFFKPILLLRDPDLIKQITIKDFDYFSNHGLKTSKDEDPYFANSLIIKTVENGWREARAKISPAFTAHKLQIMIPLIQESSQNLINYLRSQDSAVTMEMKDVFVKVCNDVISSVAFGVSVNSFENPQNIFLRLGKESANFAGWRGLIFYGYACFPKLIGFFGIKMFKKNISQFFAKIIKETIQIRKEKNFFRPDFIDLLTKDQDIVGSGSKMSDTEIISHCVTFFLAGLETVSSFLTYIVYELVLNPDVQEKLYREILENYNDTLTYSLMKKMKYLDSVIYEVLRLHSPGFLAARKCVKPYVIDAKLPSELPVYLDTNASVWIPIREIERDPRYYPNPERFDPERFNSEDKLRSKQHAYFPFGLGPRHCIGERYSLIKIKVIMIEILKQYEVVRIDKTEVPLSFKSDSFFMVPKNGLWVGLQPRT